MVTTATRPAFSLPVFAQELPAALPVTPAKSWNGQTVLTANDRLLALRESLPTFHREPFVLNGIENPNYDVIVEDDTEYPITTVSKAYGLMQHEIVFDRAMDGLSTLGFDLHGLEAEMALTAHGERLKISVTIPGYDFDPGDGCPLILRMNLLNSVDKTTSVAVELEWLRLVCGNGMMSGIGSAGFRKAHFRGIDEEDIAEYLAVSLQSVPQDRQLMHQWLNRDVARPLALSWVDTSLASLWGDPTAARVWYILRYGEDAKPEIHRGSEDVPLPVVPAHERPVVPLGPIPGAFAPVANAYHVAQALSWVAKENSNMGTRLRRIKEIPALMQQLLANLGQSRGLVMVQTIDQTPVILQGGSMPYTWTEPDVFLSHKGVDIYYIYMDDCADNPVREDLYGFYSTCADETDEGSFDIRDVEDLLSPETLATCNDDDSAILTALIDAGFLTTQGFMIDGMLYEYANSIRVAVIKYMTRQQALSARSTLLQNEHEKQGVR